MRFKDYARFFRKVKRYPTVIPAIMKLIELAEYSTRFDKIPRNTTSAITKTSWELIHEVRKNVRVQGRVDKTDRRRHR